jgi:hypothetical protein
MTSNEAPGIRVDLESTLHARHFNLVNIYSYVAFRL